MAVSPYFKRMDSFEFDSRFSVEQGIKYSEIRDSDVSYEEIKPMLEKLPTREMDLMELYYKDHKNQKDIAKMFGVTQGAISSRLSRAKKRLKFLSELPKISEDEIDLDLGKIFDEIEIDIIKTMMRTTCQSKTAILVNQKFGFTGDKKKMTQVKVRHRFEKCLNHLKEEMKQKPEMKTYHELLLKIKNNLYKLHEVKLPHFDRGERAVFSLNA